MPTRDPAYPGLCAPFKPDADAFLRNLRREGTPARVHFMELFLDGEIQAAICQRFGVGADLDRNDPLYGLRLEIALQRFLGYDYCRTNVEGLGMQYARTMADDTTDGARRASGRSWMEEHRGPIGSWEDFEKYPWPDLKALRTDRTEALSRILPDDMCIAAHLGHFCENLTWLFGYETLCYKLYDDRALVQAVYDKIMEIELVSVRALVQFPRIRIIWHSDDMGFRSGLLISPDDMREFVLGGHRRIAEIVHQSGRLSFLHSCGKREAILDDLIDDVKFDAIHSFEDTIEQVTDAKRAYGHRVALIGGIDVDFLCRADSQAVRRRVRETLDVCLPGGGYALGTGNSVANYIPVDNYLAMMDEGRLYTA